MTDPIIARTIESAVLLRSGGEEDVDDEVLATYYSLAGEKKFAICRHGLVVKGRYIANADIDRLRFDRQVKTHFAARRLLFHLIGGEAVELPVQGERGQYLDIYPIHVFLRRRVHQARRGL
jgi:hypothetical protein